MWKEKWNGLLCLGEGKTDTLYFRLEMTFIDANSLLRKPQSISLKIFSASATVSTTVSGSMGEAINPHPS